MREGKRDDGCGASERGVKGGGGHIPLPQSNLLLFFPSSLFPFSSLMKAADRIDGCCSGGIRCHKHAPSWRLTLSRYI